MTAVIIGIGQDAAGDDADGLVVARALAGRFAVRTSPDATALLVALTPDEPAAARDRPPPRRRS